jgi:hypothetical protein
MVLFYLRDSTRITLSHNALNSTSTNEGYSPVIGVNGPDSLPNSGDEGLIRYKIDRDLQWKYGWASRFWDTAKLNPAYTLPLR